VGIVADDLSKRMNMGAEEFARRMDLEGLKSRQAAKEAKEEADTKRGVNRLFERMRSEGLMSKAKPSVGGGAGAGNLDERGFAKGGSASSRADGCAQRGKTRGKML